MIRCDAFAELEVLEVIALLLVCGQYSVVSVARKKARAGTFAAQVA
jgi:hypothetical protein